MSHKFLMYEDEDGEVWVLSKNETNCDCCQKGIQPHIPNRLRTQDKPQLPRPETLPLDGRHAPPSAAYRPQKNFPQGMQIFARSPYSADSIPSTLSIDKMRGTASGDVTRVEIPDFDEVKLKELPQKAARDKEYQNYQKTAKNLNTITQQPGRTTTHVPVKKKDKKKKDRNCCKACCIECGNFCVQLLRSA